MKQHKLLALVLVTAVGVAVNLSAQPAEEEVPGTQPEEILAPLVEEAVQSYDATTNVVILDQMPVENSAEPREPESFVKQGATPPRYIAPLRSGVTNPVQFTGEFNLDQAAAGDSSQNQVVQDGERGLRMNFREAPLELVLDYLSDAAGFIIVPETDVRGKVSVWSNQPVTKEEAVSLLSTVLAKEGYAVIRDGRTLTITTQAAARTMDIPVKVAVLASNIPKDQQVVTQIIPVRFINAVQLAKDLQPLIPQQMTMTANEGGNALVITDTQQNIRRLAEIINALDTTVSSLSSVRVFPLRYADAKTVADMVKEVFASSDTTSNTAGRGGRGRFQFGPPQGDSNTANTGRPGASKVVAAADERSNSLVVSAPEDLMPTIAALVDSIDMSVDDITEIRVFRLQHADPQETSDLLASLFPDSSSSNNQNQGGFGRFFRPPFNNQNNNTSSQSDRMKRQSKVIAVPDNRTRSVIVTAARDTMEQIAKMIQQLDSDPAQQKKVYRFSVQNTDPEAVRQTLEELFSGQANTASRSASGQAGSQLNTRAQQLNQNSTTRNNNTGFGGNSSGVGRSFGN